MKFVHIKKIIKAIRKIVEPVLSFCLPAPIFLRLKRWVGNQLGNLMQPVVVEHEYVMDTNPYTQFNYVPLGGDKVKADVVVCCAFLGRHEILEVSIKETLSVSKSYQVFWVLCGSTEADLEFIKKIASQTGKVVGMLWNNNPLGEKWDACVRMAGNCFDSELYAITGSDDIISSRLLENLIVKERKNQSEKKAAVSNALYVTNEWYLLKTEASNALPASGFRCELKHHDAYVPLGAGRFYTKRFMQEVNFKVFDIERNRCLDNFGYEEIVRLGWGITDYDNQYGSLLSVKGAWHQMNTTDNILNAETIFSEDVTFVLLSKLKDDTALNTYQYLYPGYSFAAE